MEIALEKTNSAEIARALVKARRAAGSPAMDMVLTLLVVTDDEAVGEALQTATTLSREHPSRVIGVILGDGRGGPQLNAKVRVGENSSGESILLRISGELTRHAESVVLPLLLPDSPTVVWWPGDAPADPSNDAIGQFAQRRLTDSEATSSPNRALRAVARKYAPGDTDLAWTRLTPWRALLAAALDQSTGKVTGGLVSAGPGNPAATLLSPRGPVTEGGMRRWFRRLSEGVFDVDDVVRRAAELAGFLAWARHRYDLDERPIVAVGFSNGANIALATALLHPEALNRVIAFSGMFPLDGRSLTTDLSETAVLLLNGRTDPMAPLTSVDTVAAALSARGSEVEQELRDGGHGIAATDVAAARSWLARHRPAAG